MITRDLYKGAEQFTFEGSDEVLLERKKYNYFKNFKDRSYTVKQGDNLTFISNKFYGEPLYWYIIADVNEILNPFELQLGQSLIIPNLNNYK